MKKNRFLLPVAVHLFLLNEDKILLSRRYHTGYEDGNYSLVAGHIDGGETIVQAMIREAREEIGINIFSEDIKITLVMHRKSEDERIDYFLHCDKWQGEIKIMEPDKCDNLEWFPINNLPSNTIPYIARAIKKYLHGINFDTFGFEVIS